MNHPKEIAGNNPAHDSALIEQIRRGDTAAYRELFHAYYSGLVCFARKYLPDRQAAENAVQEVFTALWEKREPLKIKSSVKMYLFTAVKNRALNSIEKEKRYAAPPEEGNMPGLPVENGTDGARQELIAEAWEAIAGLPAKCREVFTLFIHHGFTYAQIAALQGVSVNTVKTQMFRAVKQLRENLSRNRQPNN